MNKINRMRRSFFAFYRIMYDRCWAESTITINLQQIQLLEYLKVRYTLSTDIPSPIDV